MRKFGNSKLPITRLVHGKGFRGTERGEGHGWYTGGAPEVRNGMEGTVGTREGLLRYGTGWRTRLVHGRGFCGTERGEGHGWYTGGDSEVRNGMEDTVGTREGLLRYGTGWRARLVHHNGYWCTKCTERRIYTQDEATPKPTQMRPACGGKGKGGKGRKGEGRKGGKGEGGKG